MSIIGFDFNFKLGYIIIYITIITLTRKINFDSKGLKVLFEITSTLNVPTILSFFQIFIIFINKSKKKKIASYQIAEIINNSNDIQNESIEKSFVDVKNYKSKKKIKFKLYLILFLCGFFEGIRYYLSITLLIGKKDISFYISGFFSLEILIFSYFILKYKSYYHHFFSVILFFICDILMALVQCLKANKISFMNVFNKFLNNTIYYFLGFFFPIIKIILEKYLIRDLKINIFVILHYEAIIQLVGFLLINIIYIFMDIFINKNYIYLIEQKLFLKEIYTHWILFSFYCILMLILKLLELVINYELGPFYFILASSAFIFERYYDYIFKQYNFNNTLYFVLDLTYYIGYTIGVLIFSEIVVLNFWKCGNTLKNIDDEESKKKKKIIDIINNMDNSVISFD